MNTPTVRAKFKVETISPKSEDGSLSSIVLSPVTSGSEENQAFFTATPCGRIEIGTVNPAAAAAFELGKEYYVDFTKAE